MICRECGSWTAYPRPSRAEQSAFHDSEAYFDHPYLVHRRAYTTAIDRRCASIIQRIGAVVDLSLLRRQRLLDVGCDTGQFAVAAARHLGAIPVGIDVAHRAVEHAKNAHVEAYVTTLEEAPATLRDFAAITAIDLIEHVADPRVFFQNLRDRLLPGGIAYVETPNLKSVIYRFGRTLCSLSRARPSGTFRRLFPPEHIQYYSREGLNRVARSCGLRVLLLGTRVLPSREIAVSNAIRLGLLPLQGLDCISGDRALLWAVLQRPDEDHIADFQ
jgi:2-polyprenyl-6-hydroxyphenyl methylase/3-demethylubiquinone-9 3-methyltransferase